MDDGIVPIMIGLAFVVFGVVFITFRNGLRRVMSKLLIAMYGRFGGRAGDSLTERFMIFLGCGFIGIGSLLAVVKLAQF